MPGDCKEALVAWKFKVHCEKHVREKLWQFVISVILGWPTRICMHKFHDIRVCVKSGARLESNLRYYLCGTLVWLFMNIL